MPGIPVRIMLATRVADLDVRILCVVERDDPLTELVAQKVVEIGKRASAIPPRYLYHCN